MFLFALWPRASPISEAMRCYQECLQICQKIGNAYTAAFVYKNLAEVAIVAERPDLAAPFCEEALKLSRELGISLAEDCQNIYGRLDQNG
jgi:tetratricopeptide (TPR) repeat protein